MKIVPVGSLKKILPSRKVTDNKTHGGKTLVIAGQAGFFGAAVLAAKAAGRVGSGYTVLMTDSRNFPIHRHPDFLIRDLKEKLDWSDYDSIAIGPGLGVNRRTEIVLRSLIKAKIKSVIVDADALTVIAKKKIFPLPRTWILTPHRGEMDRLVGKNGSIEQAYKKYQCHILLKGPKTLIFDGKTKWVVASGTRALAKAGTGDVLTGIIAGLMAQRLSSLEAMKLGAYLHGKASQLWISSRRDYLSLLASDLVDLIPSAISRLRRAP